MRQRLMVIGGDAAGMSAASQARRRKGTRDLEIVAFERGNFTSFSACGIPYFVGGVVEELDQLVARTPETFRESHDIDVRMRHEVTEIDLDRRRVRARDVETGAEQVEPFDTLMVATGAVPIRPDLPGADADGIFGVQVLDDGVAIRRSLQDHRPRRAVVVGGGYIGLEMAEAFRLQGLEVTIVDRSPQPMSTLGPDMGALVAEAIRGMGIDLRTGVEVTGFDTRDGRTTAVVTDAGTIPADVVSLGLGVRPSTDLAARAGIATGQSGGVRVDERMRTSAEGVWAAGDCVEKWHRVARCPAYVPLGTHANKEGRVAGINIGGGDATFPGIVGTAVTKICELEVARTGLTESQAVAAGFETVAVAVDSTTRAGYYPGAEPIRTKLIAEQRSGRLLGAQIIGREGAAKRIDVLAAVLWSELAVDEILNLDLGYAPPFSPVWDPVLIAARKAWERVEDEHSAG